MVGFSGFRRKPHQVESSRYYDRRQESLQGASRDSEFSDREELHFRRGLIAKRRACLKRKRSDSWRWVLVLLTLLLLLYLLRNW